MISLSPPTICNSAVIAGLPAHASFPRPRRAWRSSTSRK
nr:hypothetical protein [Citrobacter freundii]